MNLQIKNLLFVVFIQLLSNQACCQESNWRLDTRFTALDVQATINHAYPDLSDQSERISHYSGLYSINPFLLAELASTQNSEIHFIAEQLAETLANKQPLNLSPTLINSINKMMVNYRIPKPQRTATLENRPVFDLPFDHDKAWYFRGVHTNTGFDAEGVPLSAIDISSDWDLDWGFTIRDQWVAAAHDGVVSVYSSCYMRITHESGWATGYYHLENIQYRNGDVVQAGDKIANFANTYAQAVCLGGEADTPHVHFELLQDGESYALDGVEFSGWKIHAGEFSYDIRTDHMWLEKAGTKKYSLVDTINHEQGTNEIDYRYSGVYSSQAINGHGVNITITTIQNAGAETRNVVFVAFYTYNDAGQANFYTGNIDFDNWRTDESKQVELFQTNGGNFTDLQAVDFESGVINAGTMDIKFIDCSSVSLNFSLTEPNTDEVVNHDLELTKSIGIPDHVCAAPSVAPPD